MEGETRPAVDVVVIGGGVIGAATARALARRGTSVALLEKGSLTTAQGSSRGTARIIAPAAYPDASYLEMALRALEEWRELEESSGASLLELHGALYAGSAVGEIGSSFDDAGIKIECLMTAEVEQRFQITGVESEPILFQPQAGVIRADRARDALLRSAVEQGAEMHQNETVISIHPGDGRAEVRTTRRRWDCGRVVVAAGPWTTALVAELGIAAPLTVTSQSVAYFEPPPGASRMPALMEFDGDEPYALIDPHRGLKAALHRRGPETDPGGSWNVVDTEGLERVRAWARGRFPGIGEPIHTEACLYTSTPDERFILERHGAVIVGSACSGQGFQFAPETGEALARLCLADAAT